MVHNKLYQCDQCPKSFGRREWLEKHVVNHTKMLEAEELKRVKAEQKDKYQCEQCGKEFKEQGRLTEHIRQAHMKFKCELCKLGGYNSKFKVRFQTQEELDEHLRNHEDIDQSKLKECEECGKLFLNEKEYSDHQSRVTS